MKTDIFLKDESGTEIFKDLTNSKFVELIKNVRVGEEITIDNENYQITGKETDLDKNCINLFSHSNE